MSISNRSSAGTKPGPYRVNRKRLPKRATRSEKIGQRGTLPAATPDGCEGSVEPSFSALMASAEAGDRSAADALFAALYGELHRLASRQLAKGAAPELTLGTTTLLHSAYLEIADREGAVFPDRGRFMAYAARVMRGLIIDYVRRRQAHKRGGQFELTSLAEEAADPPAGGDKELQKVSEALDELATFDPPLAQLVDLKFFCGFSFVEIAAMRSISERTVKRQWEKARIYLHDAIGDAGTV